MFKKLQFLKHRCSNNVFLMIHWWFFEEDLNILMETLNLINEYQTQYFKTFMVSRRNIGGFNGKNIENMDETLMKHQRLINVYDVRCRIDASLMLLMITLMNHHINVINIFSAGVSVNPGLVAMVFHFNHWQPKNEKIYNKFQPWPSKWPAKL